MTIPSCLWACTFNLCFQNPADSALVMENNWPTLQCWLLLLLLRSVQRLICQQPPESRGGRAQRRPRRCRLATLSSSLSPKSQHSSKVSAAAAAETIRWRLQFSFGSPLTRNFRNEFKCSSGQKPYSDRIKSHKGSCVSQGKPNARLRNVPLFYFNLIHNPVYSDLL